MSAAAPDLFRAFADPLRLRILHLLHLRKELCVCDLVAALGEEQPKVSRHLATLRRAGLVAARRDGKWMHYALAPAQSPLQRTLLRCVGSCLEEVDELADDRARLEGLEAGLRCAPAPPRRAS